MSDAGEGREAQRLCSDCPPVDYPTDKTRCEPCPRAARNRENAAMTATPTTPTACVPREKAYCRGCNRTLDGDDYRYGGRAFFGDPRTGKRREARACHYGGFVCSERCDRRACLELERTMPGHSFDQTRLDGDLDARITEKWSHD